LFKQYIELILFKLLFTFLKYFNTDFSLKVIDSFIFNVLKMFKNDYMLFTFSVNIIMYILCKIALLKYFFHNCILKIIVSLILQYYFSHYFNNLVFNFIV